MVTGYGHWSLVDGRSQAVSKRVNCSDVNHYNGTGQCAGRMSFTMGLVAASGVHRELMAQ